MVILFRYFPTFKIWFIPTRIEAVFVGWLKPQVLLGNRAWNRSIRHPSAFMLVSSDSTVSHLQIHLWCFIFQLYKKQNKLLWSLETRRTEPRKSEIFDPVILLRCCNNGSVQRGKIMLVPCAHVRKQNQFRERGGSYVKCWSEVFFFFLFDPSCCSRVCQKTRQVHLWIGIFLGQACTFCCLRAANEEAVFRKQSRLCSN